MVAKISIGRSLYGALAYNTQKVNAGEGKLLATNRVFDSGDGQMDCARLLRDFCNCMPENVRTRNTVIHVSLNPHPDDRLTDMEMANIAQAYMERLGYGNQPYVIVKHEDIDRHHVHIVSVNVDEKGKRIDKDFLFRRSERIRKKLEKEFNLHPAEHKRDKIHEVVSKVDIGKGDVKKQIASVLFSTTTRYRFQTMGEYRALLSLYNIHVEETRGKVGGREYHGFVYSATDEKGNKVGNPFKASLFGKSAGYAAIEKRFSLSKKQIAEKKFTEPTKRAVLQALGETYHRAKFVNLLKAKGIDTVLRLTDEGRIYGATFIDHRTGCVLNGSRMGKELSANALQEHFTLPYTDEKPIPFTLHPEETVQKEFVMQDDNENSSFGLGLFNPSGQAINAEEEDFIRKMKRRKKRKGKGRTI
ncbi:relaxase/mobilization nuclease domain protein [Hoylesella saccharolytica F0055]|uniref:Relaxase/mobilization nuclease domain protein n=1 Tax=Hoylesella saccharolytica F0055 TaxID=1127699 RepID=L1NKA7_9BACT|nr:conjugal transfer protein MobB [Hoylesella saccharolytica]EKY03705.1 relaxase/mobilization nuclease domain protein [Hoylesella saccharolytica F0055]